MQPVGHWYRSTGRLRGLQGKLTAAGAAVGSTPAVLRVQGIYRCSRRKVLLGSCQAAYYPAGNPRPLSELLSGQHNSNTLSTTPPTASANAQANATAPQRPTRSAAAAAAASSTGRPHAAVRQPGSGLGFPTGSAVPRGTYPLASPPAAAATAVASSASASPHPFTSAQPFEAFEPGDTGFTAPSTAEVVTSSSGSVMVKVSAYFSGQPGDKVLAVGGCKALGNWEPDAAPSLTWGDGDVWTATLELQSGTHEFKCVALKPEGPPIWEPGNNRRVVVPRPGGAMPTSSGDEIDLVLGLLEGDAAEPHPEAQLVETSGGSTMVKLTTTYTAAFGEYLKVVGGPPELGAWDAGAAPALTWSEGDVWTATLELPAGEHEFKYVVVRQDGRLEWEPGENRRIHVPLPGLAAALAAAKASVAAEEAAGLGPRPAPAGRKLSPAEVYKRQEAEQQLEPWQQQGPAALPTAAANGHSKPAEASASSTAVSNGWREVKVSTKFAAQFGTFLKVVGAPQQLGAWDVVAAPPLQWAEGDIWSITLLLPPGTHEFKLVVVLPNGSFDWESGPNRVVSVQPAATPTEQPAGVLHAECQYGATLSMSSIWAAMEEDQHQAAAAAAEAAAAVLQSQEEPVLPLAVPPSVVAPADFYSKQAAAIAAAAEAQQQAAAEEAAAAAAPPPPPPKPLQPLDAVVKVFKDKFTAAPPAAAPAAQQQPEQQQQQQQRSPIASFIESSMEEQEEQQQVQEEQQQVQQVQHEQPVAEEQQQQQQQPELPVAEEEQQQQPPAADVGGRFAAVIAARQQQPPPAVLFMDSPQEQQQQQQQQQEEHEEQQQQQPEPASSSSSSGNRFDAIIAARRQQQQSVPTPPWEQQADSSSAVLPPWESEQQQQQQPASSSTSYLQSSSQLPAAVQPLQDAMEPPAQPPVAAADSSSDRWASSSSSSSSDAASSRYTSWRSSPPPVQQQQQQPEPSAVADPAPSSGGRFAAYFAQQQQQEQRDTDQSSSSSNQSSTEQYSCEQYTFEQYEREQQQYSRPTSPSWRSPSPVQGSSSSSGSSSSGSSSSSATSAADTTSASSRRFSRYTSGNSWRSATPTQERHQQQPQQPLQPEQQEQQQPQQEQQQQPSEPSSSEGGRFSSYIASRQQHGSSSSSSSSRPPSSWNAVEAGGGRGGGADYLYELGQSDYNTNVDAGQNIGMIDSLFAGNVLGHKSDIADGSLRGWEARTFNHIIGDYYIAPAFMDKVAMHITKNYLCDQGAMSKSTKVPLILGIWGPKGCGKTFQTELAFKKLGVEPVVMSAGELESETAGQPGRLIRDRYRKAAELGKTRGKLSCLLINDLDAGIGRFGNTQVTVNNQIVIGTLMNICDDPNRVSLGAGWRENDTIRRVPIIVTGNDFSTLYAPLIRDGRMEKFYWEPDREDIVNIVWQMYKEDGLSRGDIETLVATFSHQALDFFGALRAATYDGQIREWMASVAGAPLHAADELRVKEVNKRLLSRDGVPEFEPVPLLLGDLVAEGQRLVAEQEAVNTSKLAEEYTRGVMWGQNGKGAWDSSEEIEEAGGPAPPGLLA